MDLVDSAGRPPNAIVSPVVAKGRVVLRAARWRPILDCENALGPVGTVVLCLGRSEFIEKYYEVVGELLDRGLEVVVFDWRGQGLSQRLLRNSMKGHIRGFSDYEQDLVAIQHQILEPFCPTPWFALAHSMGGTVLMNFVAKNPNVFDRIVLSAPMIDIARLPMPNVIRLVAKWACRMGMGRRAVPVAGRQSFFFSIFAGNLLTSDATRFDRTAALLRSEPRLAIGKPTIRWLNAAFKAMAALDGEEFGNRFVTPTLVVMPGADAVVERRAAERLTARLRTGTLVTVPRARHEVLMERDHFRQQFWSAFDAFIPGSARRAGACPPRGTAASLERSPV